MNSTNNRILIVDDNVDFTDLLRDKLELYDFDVEIENSSILALNRITEESYDLIICDINMPGIDGLELLERIKATGSTDIPVILVTADLRIDYAMKAVRLGASDFISKPIDANSLIRSINMQLSQLEDKKAENKKVIKDILQAMSFSFRFSPAKSSKKVIAQSVMAYISSVFPLPAGRYNILQLCLDEMIENAFIHGTFSLTNEQRALEHNNYLALLEELKKDESLQDKYIDIDVELKNKDDVITIAVTDQGDGFNYKPYMDNDESELNLDATGRGINFIKILTDVLEFDNDGRTIKITKHLKN